MSANLELDNITKLPTINGITGYTFTTAMGEVLQTTIEDEGLNEFIAFLSGMLPNISEQASMGVIHQAIFKHSQTGHLIILTDGEYSLGVTTKARVATQEITQKVLEIMHWH